MWRLDVTDLGAFEERDGYRLALICVRGPLATCWRAYTFALARWEFSPDVDVNKVSVRFTLFDGSLYEIPALPDGDTSGARIPVPVLAIAAPTEKERDGDRTPAPPRLI
jgi:hypothetical protein